MADASVLSSSVPTGTAVPVPAASAPATASPSGKAGSAEPTRSADPAKGPAPEPPRRPRAADFAEVHRRLSSLNRKEAEMRAQQERLDAARQAVSGDAALVASDPLAFMTKHGLSYDQIIERIADGETVTPRTAAQTPPETSQLEKDVEELKRARTEREAAERQARDQAVVGQFKAQLAEHLKAHADRYDVIAPTAEVLRVAPEDLVFSIIEEHYRRTESAPGAQDGAVMPFDQACERVQRYYESAADRLLELPRLKSKYGVPTRANQEKPGIRSGTGGEGAAAASRGEVSSRPAQLSNDLGAAPAIAESGEPRRARGALAIDEAINRVATGR